MVTVPVPFSFLGFPVAFMVWVVPTPCPAARVNCPVNSPALIEHDSLATTAAFGSDDKSQKVEDAL
jgi:hypothetical protein